MTTPVAAHFSSERIFFYPPTADDHAPLLDAVRSLREPWLGWDAAYLEREVLACDPARGRHAWVLKLMHEVVGAVVAQRAGRDLAVNVLIVPRWQGVHFGGEAFGRVAERAFGIDSADVPYSASVIHTTFCAVNHRARRVAERLGCLITSETQPSTMPLGGRADLLRATLTPAQWAKLERGPAWHEHRVRRMIDSVLPASAGRILQQLETRSAQRLPRVIPVPVAPTSTGDAVLDALLANPPTARASVGQLNEADADTTFGGHLEALQRSFAKGWFSDDQLGSLCVQLRRNVTAGGELRNAEVAIEWIGRYMRLRPPR